MPPEPKETGRKARRNFLGPIRRPILHFQRTLGAGILVILPIGITVLVLKFFFDLLDPVLEPAVNDLLPGPPITGAGLIALIVLVYLLGLFAAQVIGRRLIAVGHRVMEVIPVVKGIYGTTRMAIEILSQNSNGSLNGDGDEQQYTGVVLIDFPRPGILSIGLVTSTMLDSDGEEVLSIYIPTTPIPSSGFLVIVPAAEVTRTDMSVEDAMRVVISGGIRLDTVFQRLGFQVPGKTRSNQ